MSLHLNSEDLKVLKDAVRELETIIVDRAGSIDRKVGIRSREAAESIKTYCEARFFLKELMDE